MTGQTTSADFPATGGALDTTSNGSDDVFVAKLNPAGTAIVYSTYLGGSGADSGTAIAVDSSGNAYVTGSTESSNFPTTAGAFDTTANGGTDVFVAKLNPTGTALVYSTFLGGSGLDAGWAVAVDSVGSAYVAGTTWSVGFPTTAGAFDTSHNGGADVFVAKVNSSGNGLAYATFLGGSGEDAALDLALDSTGNAYLTGFTSSSNFPVTSGAYDTSFNGGSFSIDAFVTNLNPTGTALLYSTFLGSNGDEWGHRIAVDAAGSAYVAGQTWSGAFPTTTGAFDTSFNGLADVFVSKLTPTGAGLSYSTFLGGADYDSPTGLTVDAAGRAALAGRTTSANYPVTAGATDPSFNGLSDAFLTRLDATGSQLLYSSFLGGAGHDSATGLALDAAGNV
ncbi:MAG: hypothetical protein FJW34_16295, partial [Acidobacteria bacterium]|nr:hypothetical protein [Acidobacteriota bacterium]